jgi:hypothetical protein
MSSKKNEAKKERKTNAALIPSGMAHRALLQNSQTAHPTKPDFTQRRPGSMSRSILAALCIFNFAFLISAQATITVTGLVSQITSGALETKIMFTPAADILLLTNGLSAGPAKTISSAANGGFTNTFNPGTYLVRLPLVGGRNAFTIAVPHGNGIENITNLIAAPWTYEQFVNTVTSGSSTQTNISYTAVTNLASFGALTNNDTRAVTLTNLYNPKIRIVGIGDYVDFLTNESGAFSLATDNVTQPGLHVRNADFYAENIYATAGIFSGSGAGLTSVHGSNSITAATIPTNRMNAAAHAAYVNDVTQSGLAAGSYAVAGNGNGLTNLDLGTWFGVWDNYRNGTPLGVGGSAYVTFGSMMGQRRVTSVLTDSTCELGTPSPFVWQGKPYFSHLSLGYSTSNGQTNNFGIMRSDENGVSWIRHCFVACSNVSPVISPMIVTAVWDPFLFTDRNGSVHAFVSVGTNVAPAQVSASMLTYKLMSLDSTLTNWSRPYLCSGVDPGGFDNDVVDFDGTNYVLFKRNNAAPFNSYNLAYTSTDLTNWTSFRTGDWLGFGSNVEAIDVHKLIDGTWFLIIGTNGSYGGTRYSTSVDFTNWTALKRYPQSGQYGNGGITKYPFAAMTSTTDLGFYSTASNSTFGTSYVIGNAATNSPSETQTLMVNGGASGWLSIKGTSATGISFDPDAVNADGYLAGRYGSTPNTYMKFIGGGDDVQFYGDIRSIQPANTNALAFFAGRGDLTNAAISTAAFTNGVAGRILIPGTSYYVIVYTNAP